MILTISKKQAKDFLNDVALNSNVAFVSDEQEAKELYDIALAKGIIVKNSIDLAVIKVSYVFPNEANSNREIVPKQELLKRLPTMIGKPLDVYHKRRYTIGYFIDYRYIEQENMIVAYAIIFKYNFKEDYVKFVKYFKEGKLKFSYKIWYDKNKVENLKDGTHILHDMQIGGGTIIPDGEKVAQPKFAKNKKTGTPEPVLDENKKQVEEVKPIHPADDRCEVLAMAMETFDNTSDEDFLARIECLNPTLQQEAVDRRKECTGKCGMNCKCFANQIIAELKKSNVTIVEEGEIMAEAQAQEEVKIAEPKVEVVKEENKIEPIPEVKVEVKKEDKLEPKEDVKLEKPEVLPTPEPVEEKPIEIKCSHCQAVLDNNILATMVEGQTIGCPSCKAIVDKTGIEKYPPQIMDFSISCTCGANKWILLKDNKESAEVRCLACSKAQTLFFGKSSVEDLNDYANMLRFVRTGEIACIQCGNSISYMQVSGKSDIDAHCDKCGLNFNSIIKNKIGKRIVKKIAEVKEPAMASKKACEEDNEDEKESYSSLTTEERGRLEDKIFAVVKEVKNEKTGETKKIRMYPLPDEEHVRSAIRYLGVPRNKKSLQDIGVSVKSVERKILKRAKELGMESMIKEHKAMSRELLKKAAKKIRETKKMCKAQASEIQSREEKLSKFITGIRKIAGLVKSEKSKVKELQLALASLQEKNEQDKKFYEANAKEVYIRKQALASFNHGLSDEEIMDDTKYELATAKKKLEETSTPELATASEVVGDVQKPIKKDNPFAKAREEVQKEAERLFRVGK